MLCISYHVFHIVCCACHDIDSVFHCDRRECDDDNCHPVCGVSHDFVEYDVVLLEHTIMLV